MEIVKGWEQVCSHCEEKIYVKIATDVMTIWHEERGLIIEIEIECPHCGGLINSTQVDVNFIWNDDELEGLGSDCGEWGLTEEQELELVNPCPKCGYYHLEGHCTDTLFAGVKVFYDPSGELDPED